MKLTQIHEQTLITRIEGKEVGFLLSLPINLSFNKRKNFPSLASKENISTVKIISIIQRGTQRDFIDIYFLIKEFDFEKIFEIAEKKYPSFNPYLTLQTPVYFKDAEKKERQMTYLKPVKWSEVKRFLIKAVSDFKKLILQDKKLLIKFNKVIIL